MIILTHGVENPKRSMIMHKHGPGGLCGSVVLLQHDHKSTWTWSLLVQSDMLIVLICRTWTYPHFKSCSNHHDFSKKTLHLPSTPPVYTRQKHLNSQNSALSKVSSWKLSPNVFCPYNYGPDAELVFFFISHVVLTDLFVLSPKHQRVQRP